jgi:hypothetical protein
MNKEVADHHNKLQHLKSVTDSLKSSIEESSQQTEFNLLKLDNLQNNQNQLLKL